MKLIGLTGGIGSGKSTVAAVFSAMLIPVYESDTRAKELMNQDPELKKGIIGLLGPEAYTPEGQLNRSRIASQVFNDPSLLQQLNSLVHPAVAKDVHAWMEKDVIKSAPYVIKESAILFEEHLTANLDAVILVIAPEALRIARVIHRDKVTEEQVRERMRHQWPHVQKIPLADYVIYNDGQRSLIEQVTDIDKMIRS